MATATKPTIPVPAFKTREIEQLEADVARTETEVARYRSEVIPAAQIKAHIHSERDLVDTADRELQQLKNYLVDTRRALWQASQARRYELSHEIPRSREYRELVSATLRARAERLEPEALLLNVHIEAQRATGAMLAPGLPASLLADVDGVVRWAQELRRLRLLVHEERLPAWLIERLDS